MSKKTMLTEEISEKMNTLCEEEEEVEDSSMLNHNVSESKLDFTDLGSTQAADMDISDPKLSITMDQTEAEKLKNWDPKDRQSTSVNVTSVSNMTLDETTLNDGSQSNTNGLSLTETESLLENETEMTDNTITETSVAPTCVKEVATESVYEAEYQNLLEMEQEREYFRDNILEVGRRLWCSDSTAQHFTKGCLWSPDGTCILVPVHADGMHVMELPRDLYDPQTIDTARPLSKLESAVHVKEGGTVYDCAWFPFMNSSDPNTCIWIATRQHEPIQMWDAFDGSLRCSYRGYDDVDEVECAISIGFSSDGDKIFGGYKKNIKIFDTNVPGRKYTSIRVKQAVSALAFKQDSNNTITTGSWAGYINHYDLRAPQAGSLFTLGGHSGGITMLRYAPTADDWLLFSGARKDNRILQWDMRNFTQPINEFEREVLTNQRIYFDLSAQLQWLASGGTDGKLRIWDLYNDNEKTELQLHQDCCNGVSFHPTLPVLATSSGQYHFVKSNEDENWQVEDNADTVIDYENSLLLLWHGRIGKR